MKKGKKTKLKEKADYYFGLFIKNRDNWACITCGKRSEPGDPHMNQGHFWSRTHMNTHFDERNVNAQCFGCNVVKKGCGAMYAYKMKQKYGENVIEELYRASQIIRPFKEADYQEIIDIYKAKLS